MAVGGYPLFSDTSALNWAWHIEHVLAIAWQRLSRQSSFQGIHWQPHGGEGQAVFHDLSGMDCPIYLLADTYIINCCHQSSRKSASCGVNLCQSDAVQPSKKLRMHHFCWAAQVCEAAWRPWQQCLTKGSWEYWKRVWLQGMKSVLWDLCFRNTHTHIHTHIHTHMRVKAYVPLTWVSTGLQCFLKYAF